MKQSHVVPSILSIKNTLWGKGVHFYPPDDDDPNSVLTFDKKTLTDEEVKQQQEAEAKRQAADKEAADKAAAEKAAVDKAAADKKAQEDADKEAADKAAKLKDIDDKIKSGLYKVDEKGDLVDTTTNTIVKTKAEIDEESKGDESIIDILTTDLGYQFLDEKGQPKVYEETEVGLLNLMKDAKVFEREQAVKELFEAFPLVAEVVDVIRKGGNPADLFAEEVDYSKIKFDEKNEELHKDILTDYYISKGFNEVKTKDLVERAKAAGKLKEDSQDALKELQDTQIAFKKQQKEVLDKQAADRETANINYWKDINDKIVTKGFLALKKADGNVTNISIPSVDRQPFYEYISKDIGKGKSQAIVDFEKKSPEEKMLIDYLFGFKKLNIDDFIDEKLKQKQAKNLRDILGKIKPQDKGKGTFMQTTHDVSENPDEVLK